MKHFRIGMIDERYFAQMRVRGRWRSLPSASHYIESKIYPSIVWNEQYTMYFSTFEAASMLVNEYKLRFAPNQTAVFTNV